MTNTPPAYEFRGTSRFEVLSRIGQGGGGLVYEVVDREHGSRLALKTLRALLPESILLLKNEFRAIQGLNHPNLVTPKELFEDRGQWFFTMEFIEGTDFLAYVRPNAFAETPGSGSEPTVGVAPEVAEQEPPPAEMPPLDEGRLRAALGQLALGLSALHADHKVHRDVKPSNVLVTPDGRVQILDFGIVSEVTEGPREDGQLVGTVVYMAPEQAAGDPPTPEADWYAVGTMLYLALTGKLPFRGNTHEVLAAKMTTEPPAPALVAPGVPEDLNQLTIDLLRTEPERRPEGFEILARLGLSAGTSSTRIARATSFVGRGDELAAIEAAFEHTVAGEAVTLFVEGDSGVGKSWLVREFTRRAVARDGALVFRGRCYERESLPYKAVDSLVNDLARFLSSLRDEEAAALIPDGVGALRAAFPVLETVPTLRGSRVTVAEVRNPREVRARMFDTFRTLLVNIALHRRLVLVIDDLQWADEDSLALLSDVLRVPGAPPLLILASLRSATEGVQPSVRERFAELPGDVRFVQLDPLPADDARELVESLLAASPGSGDASLDVDAICAEAKGHPLFIEEIVRYRVARSGGAPTRLDDALWERARSLSPETRSLLELVVIAGAPLPQHVVARAAGLEFGRAFDAVGVLRAAHFVRTSGVYRHDTIEPYHDRVRESVLEHVDEPTRQRKHAELARAFEAAGGADPEVLIPHWVGAGEADRAAECAIEAGEASAAALAFDHAASLFRLALELRKPVGDAAIGLKEKLAEALTNAGRGADAGAVYLDAAAGADSMRAIDLRRRAGEQLVCSGHVNEGTRVFESALEAMGIRVPRTPAAILLSLLASNTMLAVRGLGFVPRAAATLDPRALLRVNCLLSAGPGLGMSDHLRGKEFQVRTLGEALKLGEPARVGRALAYYGLALASAGVPAFGRVMAIQKTVESMARELKLPYLDAMASGVAAFAYYLTGRPREACAAFEQTEAVLRDQCIGVAYELGSTRMLLYRSLVQLGELKKAARLASATLRDAEQKGDIYTVLSLRASTTVMLALVRDDVAAADRENGLITAKLTTRGFYVQHFYALLARAQVALYRGDLEAADGILRSAAPAVKRSMLLHVQNIRILFADQQARACLALAAARGATGASMAKNAGKLARSLEGEGWGAASAQAGLVRAGLAHVAGDRKRALAHLVAAEEEFASLGMALYVAVVRRRRGALLGGGEGAALVAESEAWMSGQDVRHPARLAAFLSPGFYERAAR